VSNKLTNDEILAHLTKFSENGNGRAGVQAEAVRLLKENFGHFDWVGIYNLEPPADLVLGPYLGKPSPHTRIPVGEGICGAAAQQQETIVVDDVNADERYLACSLETRSEIVVPIFSDGKVIGEIDIDSNQPAAFKDSDREFLEAVAEILSKV